MPAFVSVCRARLRSAVVPVVGAALLVGLLPFTAAAQPPDPESAEVARDDVSLLEIPAEQRVDGGTHNAGLDSIEAAPPADLEQAPAGTVTPPTGGTGSVTFGAAGVQQAGVRSIAGTATPEAAALEPVGTLPVKIGQAPGAATPTGTWQVGVSPRTAPEADGIDGALVTVTAPVTGSVPVSVQLDYKAYQNFYGADWASRLTFVQFPECYRTTPEAEECQAYEELETVNDTSAKTLTATVDPAADGTVTPASAPASPETGTGTVQAAYRTGARQAAAGGDSAVVGAVDSGAGESGSFKATPLESNGKWSAGSSSGAFTWSYPIDVPPAPAGPAPEISFDYNSQSVDAKTSTSSPQASWIGEGWDYNPGYIERRYRTCKDDREDIAAGAPNNAAKKSKTSDLCWVSYNAVMSLGGATTELVRIGETDRYRPQQDDGTRVELKTGATNGDNNGEYWVVTKRDGTVYTYGLNKIGGGHEDTQSVFTVPVFGNHPGEPCHATAFADSRCQGDTTKQQAWHWGLDKVTDVNGNVMVVNWHQSTNYYAVNKKFKTPEKYVRGGLPDSVEYGLREGALGATPAAKIDFLLSQRCLQDSTVCDSAKFDDTKNPASYRPWWDSPGNLNCKSDSKLCPAFPSFWNRMRLGGITTYAQRPGVAGLSKVDTYMLDHSFPRDWYDTSPGLWLNSIQHYGFRPGDTSGTLLTKSGVSFQPYVVGTGSAHPLSTYLKDQQLPNLVPRNSSDPRPGFTRPRIGAVATEHGADIEVTYKGGCRVQPDVAPEDNHGTCFPVRWSPDAEVEKPALAWFNKYVVHTVTETDRITGVSARISTRYDYSGAAWGKSDDEFSKPALRTYSEWRGYQQVATSKGSKISPAPGRPQTQSYSVTRYFRGAGGPVKDSTGTVTLTADDIAPYAGMTAETIAYTGTGGKVASRVLNRPWAKQTASREREGGLAPLTAYRSGFERSDTLQTLGSSWQGVRTTTVVDDTYGLPQQVESAVVKPDGAGGETLSDQTCAKTSYVVNEAANLVGLPKEIRTTSTSCAGHATADPATQVMSAVRTSYDDGAWGAAPVKGLATTTATLDDDGSAYSIVHTNTFDPLGRVRKITDPLKGVSETQYTPGDAGGPVTAIKKINQKGHASTTTLDPGRGLALSVTDANGHVSRMEYDAFGRLVKGWSADAATPDVLIDYQMATATPTVTRPTAVTVRSLKDNGSYSRQVTVYDGLMRPVQTQDEAHGPGRIIQDTRYDDHGLVSEQTGSYLAKGEPETGQFKRVSDTLVPNLVRNTYDGLGRPVRKTTVHSGSAVWYDSVEYGDNWTISRPAGGAAPAVRAYSDARGRIVRIDHSTNRTQDEWRTTRYSFDARGNRSRIEDHAGNLWTYTYNTRGLLASATDPDIGSASFTYDALGRQASATDSRRQTTYTEYDAIGRVLKVRQGSATADPVKSFTYDLPGALGKAASATRHEAGADWIDRITAYDDKYRPATREIVVPSQAGPKLAGTYTYRYAYTEGGKQLSVSVPAIGGLAAEKVITRYNEDGLAESTSGLSWYTSDVTYSAYGEPLRTVSGPQPYRVWTTNFINQETGRLQRTVWDRETTSSHRISDSYYSWDRAGNLTSAARKQTDGTASAWDNQCFTYDYLGELVHAWTSGLAVTAATGCKSASGTAWGYRSDGQSSAGPIAEAPDAVTDAGAPDAEMQASLDAAAPATGSVATTAGSYYQSFTFDAVGNRASLTDRDPANPALDLRTTYGYGKTVAGNGTSAPTLTQPHLLTSVDRPTGTDPTYVNDATGNTTERHLTGGDQVLDWNAENKLASVTGTGDGAGPITGLNGKCVDLQSDALTDGTPIQLHSCNGTPAQAWQTTGDTLRIRGKCATVNGALVQLAACNGSTAQKFTLRAADKAFVHAATGKCLAVPGTTDAEGTDLQVVTCATGAAQQWALADRTTYVYDTGGNRILQKSAAGTTLFLGETEVSTDAKGNLLKASRIYQHPGAPSVVRVSKNGSSTHVLSVLLNDTVGTATTSVEQSTGQPVTRRSFKPYGEVRGTRPQTWPNARSYLGTGVDDTYSGLTHLGAREYDQSTGRFLSADPVVDFADPLQINGYAYANNNPITKSDPDGLQPIECWEGTAVCRGGRIISVKEDKVKPTKALTETKVTQGNKTYRVIYDDRGVPHTVGSPGKIKSERVAIEFMNDDLRTSLDLYDPKTGNGSEYLWQDDNAVLPKKGLVHDANGNHRVAGATADFIKVTWKNGKIVDVETWDANESTQAVSGKSLDSIEKTINNKLDIEGKKQSQKVVFVAHSMEQAEAVRDRFVGNANVRVIFAGDGKPGSVFFDTHASGGFRGGGAPGTGRPGGRGSETGSGKRGGGGLGGKIMNGAGILGDLAFIWEGWKTLERGCDDVVVSCGPPPTA
ncbi:ricin-type beta-trefoil lectin domain protein [Streptomyces sp. NBC_01013]|uniref:ricin-type beta-trefoil lectin domain protein n=1 Tax=Streptomyces sp. NBC_01013 TaxID=2903718 RepID=UPI0038661CE9|nr:ricin-type beta-trefoil lectin domain protein [Streptomyces sp. NBC_01013]